MIELSTNNLIVPIRNGSILKTRKYVKELMEQVGNTRFSIEVRGIPNNHSSNNKEMVISGISDDEALLLKMMIKYDNN